jgi:Protein of unknown function (DUF3631)
MTNGNSSPRRDGDRPAQAVAIEPLAGWLHRAEDFIRRFVVLSDDQACAIVLWIAHTYAFKAAVATPYLAISSAEMESGKTRLLEVLRLLVFNPWFTGRTTTAALTRKIDSAKPTLLLDESDPAFGGDKEYAELLRGVLNTGYREGGAVTVCVGQGATLDARDFSTFCPKAIAGIGKLPDTVQSRSIPIRLKKRLPSETIERFRERKVRSTGEAIADGLALSLTEEVLEALHAAEPELPDELSDRAQDVWEPLLAIADAACGDWPERARGAAVRLSARTGTNEATVGVRLLADIQLVFLAQGTDKLWTKDLLDQLNGLDESPWGGWNDGDGIRSRELGKKLRPYEIHSKSIRIGDGARKGYAVEDFHDAFARHLGDENGSQGAYGGDPKVTRVTTALESQKPRVAQSSHGDQCDLLENAANPHSNADVTHVTLGEPSEDGSSELGNVAETDRDAVREAVASFEEAAGGALVDDGNTIESTTEEIEATGCPSHADGPVSGCGNCRYDGVDVLPSSIDDPRLTDAERRVLMGAHELVQAGEAEWVDEAKQLPPFGLGAP